MASASRIEEMHLFRLIRRCNPSLPPRAVVREICERHQARLRATDPDAVYTEGRIRPWLRDPAGRPADVPSRKGCDELAAVITGEIPCTADDVVQATLLDSGRPLAITAASERGLRALALFEQLGLRDQDVILVTMQAMYETCASQTPQDAVPRQGA